MIGFTWEGLDTTYAFSPYLILEGEEEEEMTK